ncbi:MAG TPA: hypothetical protein VHS53_00120, partial [Mucilaginibacter sp.]|nr:hypothetical protein [Mucilaginibacter sp.]
MKVSLYAVIALLILSFTPCGHAMAQKKHTDTVSSTGLQFSSGQADTTPPKNDTSKAAHIKQGTGGGSVSGPEQKTLWQIFIAGLVGGFLALLMPCIYPLLPLTVSFFTKRSGNRSKGIMQSVIYGLSIIVIYVSLGLIITLLFGSDALNALATNGIFNLFFFLLLVVFGISFLG